VISRFREGHYVGVLTAFLLLAILIATRLNIYVVALVGALVIVEVVLRIRRKGRFRRAPTT
jgi:Flp pilus assembly protein TadB